MKQINFLKYVLVFSIFIFVTACDKEDTLIDTIPTKVKNELASKFPNASISSFSNYVESFSSDTICEIEFINKNESKTIAWYKFDGTWKMTKTELKTVGDLTPEAKEAFTSSIYGNAEVDKIYKTERDEIEGSLYTLSFKFPSLVSQNDISYAFITDDGLFLNKYTKSEFDERLIVSISDKQVKFIDEKYEDAEIRGYINNSGIHEYFILHGDLVKHVFFEWSNLRNYWKETRYELDVDTVLPDNVVKYMEKVAPDFVYTNIYYIENNDVNKYFLVDRSGVAEKGHYVNEDIGLSPKEQ